MNEATRENILFFLTIANIVAGAVSIALAAVAISAIRELARRDRPPTQVKLGKRQVTVSELQRFAEDMDRFTAELQRPPIRRSALLGADRRLNDDFWG